MPTNTHYTGNEKAALAVILYKLNTPIFSHL